MHARRYAGRYLGPVAGVLMLTGALTGFTGALTGSAPARAATVACQSWTADAQPPPVGTDDALNAVAVPSASEAWAVGNSLVNGVEQPLIEHWAGSSWSVVPGPPLPGGTLMSVRSASPSSVWAVGASFGAKGSERTLILHWNGTAWSRQSSASPGTSFSVLNGVRAVSATNAWAVGDFSNGGADKTLTLHWNGTTWTRVNSPDPAVDDSLAAVAATSGSNLWAVGLLSSSAEAIGRPARPGMHLAVTTDPSTFILHGNGSTWSKAITPSPGSGDSLDGVGATSTSDAWAVGSTFSSGNPDQTLVLHWDGSHWRQVPAPSPGGTTSSALSAVTATSVSNAWAVGGTTSQAFILQWDGTSWQQVTIPSLPPSQLNGVAASSAANAWAVGEDSNGTTNVPLALHCT